MLGGEAVVFTVDTTTYCISYVGMEVGQEQACIRVCDNQGVCFITDITVNVVDERLAFQDTINIGARDTFCVDTTLLAGTLVSIRNTCPLSADSTVLFTIDTSTYCIAYQGLRMGIGQACIEICDNTNQCDTINLTITVTTDTLRAPIAVPDRDTTPAGQILVLNPLVNDSLFSDSIDITIAAMPANGNVLINPDGTFSYTPNDNFCGMEDVFMYQICNPAGCDTARVFIFVQCTTIEIFPGFSPNGDGVNDTFIINGLAGFPNHVLQVFDRRGTRVFFSENYKNDWDGTWEGKDLPDGIYFYILDDGKGGMFSGYLQIRR